LPTGGSDDMTTNARILAIVSTIILGHIPVARIAVAGDPDRCVVETKRAADDVATAEHVKKEATGDPAYRLLADQLMAAARERLRAVEVMCRPAPPAWEPNLEKDPFEVTPPPRPQPPLKLIPVPGIPWLVDPVVERECLAPGSTGLLCPIVVVVPPNASVIRVDNAGGVVSPPARRARRSDRRTSPSGQ
jgi:hypothetical protein